MIERQQQRRALQITSAILTDIARRCGIDESEARFTISHEGELIAQCSLAEALDLADAALAPVEAEI